MNGKQGEDMVMPSMAWMEDEKIAAILSYLRNDWGHSESPITPEEVAEVRQKNTRKTVWTDADLEALK